MIPGGSGVLTEMLEFKELPTKTYKLNTNSETIAGYTDELEAVKQAIFLILNTERYEHVIYGQSYGVELAGLIGMNAYEILPEVQMRITEALLQDPRIEGVDNFTFDVKKGVVHVRFIVHTVFGETEMEKEVVI